jgi:hypothetical protein
MECKFRQRIFAKSICFEASPEIPLYRSFLEHSSPRSAELSSRGELVKSSSEVSTKLISAGSEDDFRKATPNRVIEIRSVILNSSTTSTETKVGGHPKFTVHISSRLCLFDGPCSKNGGKKAQTRGRVSISCCFAGTVADVSRKVCEYISKI